MRASSNAARAPSRAIIVDSETDGTPPIPSAAETSPSCIEPPAESSGSSSCSAIGRPTRRWYWSARRITRALRIGSPSSEKPTAPAAARSHISVSSSPAMPLVTVATKPGRDRGLLAAPARAARRRRPRCRPAARCWPSRRSRRSRPRRRRASRSRRPPCPRARACAGARAGRRRRGTAARPSASITSAPSASPAPGLGELGDLALADDDVAASVEPARGSSTRAPRITSVVAGSPSLPRQSSAEIGRRSPSRRLPDRRRRRAARGRPRSRRRGSPPPASSS